MSEALLLGAAVSLAWPVLSLFEVADGRNLVGSLGAFSTAIYLRDTPLIAYGAGALIFGVSTYMLAKNSKAIQQDYKIYQGWEKDKDDKLGTRHSDALLLGGYIGSNLNVAIFVTSMQAAISAQQ